MEKITRRKFLTNLITTGGLLAVEMMENGLAFAEAVDPRKITSDIWKSIDFSPERINPYLYKNILPEYKRPVFAFCDSGIDSRLTGELPNINLVGGSADYDVMTERREFHGTWMVQAYTGIYGGISTISPFVGSNFQDTLDINCYNLMHYDSAKGITPLPNARDMFLESNIVVNSLHSVLHYEAPDEFSYFRSRKGLVITSAGNYDSPTQAAYALPEDVVLRVGALDENMNPAGYSVWKKPDGTLMDMIFAPGFLLAKDPKQNIYNKIYGTSCAVQWVGMTAKIIQMVNPFLNGGEIKGVIVKSCKKVRVDNIDPVIAERYPDGILILDTHRAVVNAHTERLKEKIFIPMINQRNKRL